MVQRDWQELGKWDEYINADGSVNTALAIHDYAAFLEYAPRRELMMDGLFQCKVIPTPERFHSAFGFFGENEIWYDVQDENFRRHWVAKTLTHELSHWADSWFFHAQDNQEFVSAIEDAGTMINADSDLIALRVICDSFDRTFGLTDIVSAIVRGRAKWFKAGKTHLWEDPITVPREIFADIMTIEVLQENTAIDVFKLMFPRLWEAYKHLKMKPYKDQWTGSDLK